MLTEINYWLVLQGKWVPTRATPSMFILKKNSQFYTEGYHFFSTTREEMHIAQEDTDETALDV